METKKNYKKPDFQEIKMECCDALMQGIMSGGNGGGGGL